MWRINKKRLRANIMDAVGDRTNKEISEEGEISAGTVSAMICGQKVPTLVTLLKLSMVTDVSLDKLTEGVLEWQEEQTGGTH